MVFKRVSNKRGCDIDLINSGYRVYEVTPKPKIEGMSPDLELEIAFQTCKRLNAFADGIMIKERG